MCVIIFNACMYVCSAVSTYLLDKDCQTALVLARMVGGVLNWSHGDPTNNTLH